MIRQYQRGEILKRSQKELEKNPKKATRKQRNLHTFRLDTELANQIDYLVEYWKTQKQPADNPFYKVTKLDLIRQLVSDELTKHDLWNKYNSSPKRFLEKEVLTK